MATNAPRKRFGQHFLVDPSIIDRIIATIDPQAGDPMLEIGPGRGAITIPLMEKQVYLRVIELDRDLYRDLEKLKQQYPRLEVLNQDALTLKLGNYTQDKLRVVGNLPYNISSPLLFRMFEQGRFISDMVFMLQKEVVDRLCAKPGHRDYSRLSVMAQFYCELERQFDVNAEAFYPPPEVTSAIVTLRPKPPAPDIDPVLFSRVVQKAFSQRRKMLRNNLGNWLDDNNFDTLGIDPSKRAQELTLEAFKGITRFVDKFVYKNDG
ncbi:MAG: 16S rRNA (adenine(1518)-N(6)/adenine(1519)-N(6))-dimethyltransferase RsmA, partial [Gammaproteobacteria bacterium]|nr:16S rRNA (adenine(1518)-N(6)/adenine(1519)-N(6))-dimethyltransferase RsmA [Gammaproteobacteria bacterium]